MKSKILHRRAFWFLVASWASAIGGCSTAEITPPTALPPPPPPLVKLPHPAGYDIGDLRAIFLDKAAPKDESLKTCDADFAKLRELTQSQDEQRQGARELVKKDPVRYHWCFYSKIASLDEQLKKDNFVDERQKVVLESYLFLVPIARGFQSEFNDTRYLRWAVQRYRKLSEWVFFRRVELSPKTTSELTAIENPFGVWREPVETKKSVLEKYNIATETKTPVLDATVTIDPSETKVNPAEPLAEAPVPLPVSAEPEAPAEPERAPATDDSSSSGAILDGTNVLPAD